MCKILILQDNWWKIVGLQDQYCKKLAHLARNLEDDARFVYIGHLCTVLSVMVVLIGHD